MLKQRWLITGSGGQIGFEFQKELSRAAIDFLACDRKILDITNLAEVKKILLDYKPDVVVNCAAWTNVDFAENHQTEVQRINSEGVENLVTITNQIKAKFLQISTDYVFDGRNKSPYLENDQPNPINIYGLSKYSAEKIVENNSKCGFIFRTSWVYGENGNNFVKTVLRNAEQGKIMKVVDDQFGQPTWANDVATKIIEIVTKELPPNTYHLTSDGKASWFTFASNVLKINKLPKDLIQPCSTSDYLTLAKRPTFSMLNSVNLEQFGIQKISNWADRLKIALPTFPTNVIKD